MNLKKTLVYVLCSLALFLVLAYGFVPQVLSGKIVNQSDISGWQGMAHEMMEWNSSHPDDQTAWTGSMFSGMPTATIHASTEGDWTQSLYDLLLTGRRPATYLFISLLGAWLLMLSFGVHPLLALGGAVAVTFCSYNLQIIQVGHNTKMQAIAFLPWVLSALSYTWNIALKKKNWLALSAIGAALFGLTLSFQVKANHPQITYYLALMILLYAIVMIVYLAMDKQRRKGLGRFFASCLLLLVLGCTGIATNAIKLLPTYEYTPYSMRGGTPADESKDGKAVKGLDLDYATAWSYGWQELPNMMIPSFNGGSSAGAVNPDHSRTYDLLKASGQQNLRTVSKNLPLYWGPQPFTAGPMYMGAVTVFLFLLSLLCCSGKDKWWLIVCTILAVLLGVGSHFMPFTKFFYDYIPFYNKFRTVSMALVVLQFTLPLLAFIALDRLVRSDDAAALFKRRGWIALALSGGFCLLCALIPSIAGSFTSASDSSLPDALVYALSEDRRYLLRVDALRSAVFIVLSFLCLLWGCTAPKSAAKTFATQELSRFSRRRTAALMVCALVAIDLISVDFRYLNSDDFVTPRSFQSQFDLRSVDKMILHDSDPSYRVLDLTVDPFNDSHPSYHHKNIGGYSPAKLRNYQTFIDNTLRPEINEVYRAVSSATSIGQAEQALPYLEGLASLNCRYIIVDDDLPPLRYPYAKGNAWFENGDSEGTISLLSYAPNELKYEYDSPQGGNVVFSEVYYPAGWTLTLDGDKELEINEYDGILRSAQLPAGEHSLVMRFAPRSYSLGESISRWSSIALVLAVLLSLAFCTLVTVKEKATDLADS